MKKIFEAIENFFASFFNKDLFDIILLALVLVALLIVGFSPLFSVALGHDVDYISLLLIGISVISAIMVSLTGIVLSFLLLYVVRTVEIVVNIAHGFWGAAEYSFIYLIVFAIYAFIKK